MDSLIIGLFGKQAMDDPQERIQCDFLLPLFFQEILPQDCPSWLQSYLDSEIFLKIFLRRLFVPKSF